MTVSRDALLRYRDRRLADLVNLREALARQDFTAIREVGHRIKGNAPMYGFHGLAATAVALEVAALAADGVAAERELAQFAHHIESIQIEPSAE